MKRSLILLLLLTNLGAANADQPIAVSILNLISQPQKFDGTLVRVIGYFRAEREGDAIYLHKEDYRLFIAKNGLWVDLDLNNRGKAEKLSNGYVLLEGVFNSENQGHLSGWSGSIEKVQRIERWVAPKVPPLSNPS